jgi:hypothetical protein
VWFAKTLLLAHVVAAGVLVGSSTHLALQSLAVLQGRVRTRLLRVYPPVALVAWAVTFGAGAWLYPRYRLDVRDAWLDVHAVWASVLFDIKENLAVFVGPLLAASWWLAPSVIENPEPAHRRWFAAMCASACVIAWWNLLSGLLINSMRSV